MSDSPMISITSEEAALLSNWRQLRPGLKRELFRLLSDFVSAPAPAPSAFRAEVAALVGGAPQGPLANAGTLPMEYPPGFTPKPDECSVTIWVGEDDDARYHWTVKPLSHVSMAAEIYATLKRYSDANGFGVEEAPPTDTPDRLAV